MQGSEARVSCSGSAMRQGTHEYRQFSMILAKSLCGNPCTFTQPKTKFSPLGMICNISRQAFILWWHLNTFCSNFGSSLTQSWAKKIACCSDKIKIPFQILFYPFRCMFKIMKGYKIFDFTPSGKSLKKTLVCTELQVLKQACMLDRGTVGPPYKEKKINMTVVQKTNKTSYWLNQ